MEENRQLRLLEAIAATLGVTQADGGVRQLTVGRLFMLYKTTRERGRRWQLERNLLRPFVVRFWRRAAADLGAEDWREHRARRRRSRTRLGRAPCDLTLNLELAAAKRLLRTPGFDVRSALTACRPVKTRTRRESWFTAAQIVQLLEAAPALRWYHQQVTFAALVAVMADTGLRISEALSLRWDRITLRGTTSVLGKGSKTRVVAFTPRALTHLARIDRDRQDPRVFFNHRRHTTYNPSTVRSWFRQAIAAAGLEGVKADGDLALVPHTLRHSAASIADERGAPATWIQAMLGHAHLATTEHYLHRSAADAAIRMAAIMGDRRPARKSGRVKKIVASENRRRVEFIS